MTWITILWFIFVPIATLLFGYGKGYLDGAMDTTMYNTIHKK